MVEEGTKVGEPPARGVADELRGASEDLAREARATGGSLHEEGSGLVGSLRQGLSEQVEQGKNSIADRLATVAERAQRSAGDLRADEPWLGNLLGRGASELESLATELRRNEVSDLMGSVETFARRQPALFMGASVALGYALTRFVGASGTQDASPRYGRPPGYAPHVRPTAGGSDGSGI